MTVPHRLSPLFDFSSIAVVGASDRSGTGGRPYQSLQGLGFSGRYYPVNSRADRVHGLKAYPNVSSLPETPEMVVILVPRDAVAEIVEECARIGVKAVFIGAAGFLERDERGAELQARITAAAREYGLLVVGPNCMGVVSMVHRTAACTLGPPTQLGNVAIVSHSGGLMNEVTSNGPPRGFGFSHMMSCGNEAGVTAADAVDYFVDDPSTDVILAILETVRDPDLFAAATTRALVARKPVVVLKMGVSEQSARSAITHTGAIAGNDVDYTELFRRKGIIRVDDIDELVDMGALLATAIGKLRNRRMERAGIIEISGGGKGLVCDTAAAAGVELPELSESAVKALRQVLEDDILATNPIDSGGSWSGPDKPTVYPVALSAFASEPDVDVVVSRFTIPRTGELGTLRDRIAELEAARAAHPDRLFAVLSRTSDQYCQEWETVVRERGITFLQGYGRGLRALGRLAQYSRVVHGTTRGSGSR